MKNRNIVFILWLGVMALVITSLAVPLGVQAQICNPLNGACPQPLPTSSGSSGGPSGKKNKSPNLSYGVELTATQQALLNEVATMGAETETAGAPTLTATPCALCPSPKVPPTIVAGPVFLRPGVVNMIIAGLVVVLAGGLILVFRNR